MAARCVETAVQGAVHNILINLGEITDENFKNKMKNEAADEVKTATENRNNVLEILDKRS